jgi:hypothetical protein
MKKIILTAVATGFILTSVNSQINRPEVIKKKTTPAQTKTTPASTTTTAPVYSITAAKVNIRTGQDNKEFPSAVYIEIWQKDHPGGALYGQHCLFKVHDLKNEMTSNSTTELGLEKYNGAQEKFLLSTIQQYGLELTVGYQPNFFMDAWKIENITWTLEFRDQNGNLHPTMGTKIISFSNASGFLNNEYTIMKCITDQNLNPLTASIRKN